jgi:hypothetical protein
MSKAIDLLVNAEGLRHNRTSQNALYRVLSQKQSRSNPRMADEQRRLLEQQLWNIANTLRGKMDADEFRDYILGFIFYKYLSER